MEKIVMLKRVLYSLMIVSLIPGCTSEHIVFVQEASMGLNISIGTEGTQKLSLGYDRDIYAIVPKKNKNNDAMSLFSINRAEITGLDNMDISEFIAVGEPAKKIANDVGAVNTLRFKIYGK